MYTVTNRKKEACLTCGKCDTPMTVLEYNPVICDKCKKECKEMIDDNPTWYGKMYNDKLVTTICIDCWNQGKRF